MTFNNIFDIDLEVINNLINNFYHGLNHVDFQYLFYRDEDFLINILHKVKAILKNREYFRAQSNYDLSKPFSLQPNEIKIALLALEIIPEFFDDYDIDIRIGLTSEDLTELHYKLKILLSEKAFDRLLYNDLIIMKNVIEDFSQWLIGIDTQNLSDDEKEFVQYLLCTIDIIIKNRIFCEKNGAYNPQQPFSLNQNDVKIIIGMIEASIQSFDVTDNINTTIDFSLKDLKEFKSKLGVVLSDMSFCILYDNDLRIMSKIMHELNHELSYIYLQFPYCLNKQNLEKIESALEGILHNRLFLKDWGVFDSQQLFSLNQNEIKEVIQALEITLIVDNVDSVMKVTYSRDRIKEIKDKLEFILSKIVLDSDTIQ